MPSSINLGAISSRPLLTLSSSAVPNVPLKAGEVVSATVLSDSSGGRVNLELVGKLVDAQTELTLLKGQQLQLRAEPDGSRLLLRLLDDPLLLLKNRILRTTLPRQESIQNLMSELRNLVKATPEAQWKQLPQPVRQAVEQIINLNNTSKGTLTPDGLRSAIQNSGLFLENRLATAPTQTVEQDLKALILRLINAVQRAPTNAPPPTAPTMPRAEPELNLRADPTPAANTPTAAPRPMPNQELLLLLLQRAESALAKIQTSQLQSSQVTARRADEPTVWVMELPVHHNQQSHSVAITIRREAVRAHAKAEDTWSVIIDLSSESYGSLQAVIALTEGELSTTFWAERPATTALFTENLETLKQRLSRQGLSISKLVAYTGKIDAASTSDMPTSRSLLDEKA